MTRAELAEEIKKLLPNEEDKRIRLAIMKAYGNATFVAAAVRDSINIENRLKNGILMDGVFSIDSPISASLSGWAWVMDFAVQEGSAQNITIQAPDIDHGRIDYFHGNSAGTILYTPGIIDNEGNSLFPSIPKEHIIIKQVLRNPNGTNQTIEIPSPEPILNFGEDDMIPVTRSSRLESSKIRVNREPSGEIISYVFPKTAKGIPAQEADDFVTLQQLPQMIQYGRISGGEIQWTGIGLEYNIAAVIYALEGIKTVTSGVITLDPAHPTLPRFDIYGWNILGQRFYRAGTPQENPPIPDIDPATEVLGTPIFLPAAALVPPGVFNTIIYAENVPGEWTPSFTGSGTANFGSTANPKSGTKSIEISNMANGSVLTLMAAEEFNFADFETLGFDMILKSSIFAGHSFNLRFVNNLGTAVSNSIPVTINKTLLSYQFVGISLNSISKFQPTARGIQISFVRTRGASILAGYFVDNIKMQGGVTQPGDPGNPFPEPEDDGKLYGRKPNAWHPAVPEAPANGKPHLRQDNAWQEFAPIVDYIARTGNTISFEAANKYGYNGTPLTGNLTISITGAQEINMPKVLHDDGTIPLISVPGGVSLHLSGGAYDVSKPNELLFICHKNNLGVVTRISYTISPNLL